MRDLNLAYVIIRTMPESILFMMAGYILLNLEINKTNIFKSGLILGIIVTGIRSLPLAYGIHTVLAMMIGGFILTKITNLPLPQTVMATCGIFVSLALSEGIYVFIAEKLLNISIKVLTEPNAKGAITSLPSLALFIAIVVGLKCGIQKFNSKSKVN